MAELLINSAGKRKYSVSCNKLKQQCVTQLNTPIRDDMKKLMILCACLVLGAVAFAQEETTPDANEAKSDTTRVRLGDLDVTIVDNDEGEEGEEGEDEGYSDSELKSELTHWGGIDLGVNMLLNKDGGTDLGADADWLDIDEARSLSWSFNIYEQKIRIVKDYVGLITGVGITYNSYGLKNNVSVLSNSDSTYAVTVPDSLYTFDKNKIRTTYVKVPLMLEFNTSSDPDRTFHLAAGVVGGVRIGSITKQEFKVDDAKHKNRVKDDFNFSPLTLDAAVRVGYKNLTLFANYGLTPLFEDEKGPEVYPLTVGVQILPW